ncbi:MAG: cold shock domain-containing protein [Burkholderiales bacterium]|nr:cold shock domain-containing protein [Burkholderiales bacterium]
MPFEGGLQQWSDERGFGFVEVEATRERVFVHATALPRDGTRPATGGAWSSTSNATCRGASVQ